MPGKFLVVMRHRREHSMPDVWLTEMVLSRRFAINRDKKPTAFGNPLGHRMGQPVANR